jgi:hypothetical protein
MSWTSETIALVGGLLFLLIAIVGGGFSAKEVVIPRVPAWGRMASLLLGAALVLPYFLMPGDDDGPRTNVASAAAPAVARVGESEIYSDAEGSTSPDGIEVSGLIATGVNRDPAAGDRVRIRFSLRNAGSEPADLTEAFVAARNPDGDNRDFASAAPDEKLAPGATLAISGSIAVDAPGVWQFFPCYSLGAEDGSCPDEWRAFEVAVRQ